VTYVERATDLNRANWRKSTRSGNTGGSCVEVAEVAGMVAVRDSKDPSGPAYLFGRQHWATFVQAVRSGAFDLG
jgi:hypothetical protein